MPICTTLASIRITSTVWRSWGHRICLKQYPVTNIVEREIGCLNSLTRILVQIKHGWRRPYGVFECAVSNTCDGKVSTVLVTTAVMGILLWYIVRSSNIFFISVFRREKLAGLAQMNNVAALQNQLAFDVQQRMKSIESLLEGTSDAPSKPDPEVEYWKAPLESYQKGPPPLHSQIIANFLLISLRK